MSGLSALAHALAAYDLAATEEDDTLLITAPHGTYRAWIDRGTLELHTSDLRRVLGWRPVGDATPERLARWVADALHEWEAERERRAAETA